MQSFDGDIFFRFLQSEKFSLCMSLDKSGNIPVWINRERTLNILSIRCSLEWPLKNLDGCHCLLEGIEDRGHSKFTVHDHVTKPSTGASLTPVSGPNNHKDNSGISPSYRPWEASLGSSWRRWPQHPKRTFPSEASVYVYLFMRMFLVQCEQVAVEEWDRWSDHMALAVGTILSRKCLII